MCPGPTHFDKFHACKHNNKHQFGLGDVYMPESKLNDLLYLEAVSSCPKHRQNFRYINRDFKEHQSMQSLRGKIAVATVVGRTNSPRYQDSSPNPDQLACAIVLQYLSIKEKGGVPFGNGVFDYVVIMSDGGTEIEQKILKKFGIIIKVLHMPPEKPYKNDPFERGAMMKVHGISLTEYDRVLLLDGDMFATISIEKHFLIEYAADMVTSVHESSPIAGNWIILRPNSQVYKAAWEMSVQRNFDLASGWNKTGLYTWPSNIQLPCNAEYLHSDICQVNKLWVDRCQLHHIVSWTWIGAGEVQGIFAWIYHQSGLGTSFFINAFDSINSNSLGQGAPWWHHYQGSNKPWIMKNRSPESCPGGTFYNVVKWFWEDFYPLAESKYTISSICPSYPIAKSSFENNTGC